MGDSIEMGNPIRLRATKGPTLALIAILAVSTLTVVTSLASAQPGQPPNTYDVNWQKEPFTQGNNWTYNNIEWLFGPTIETKLTLLNGTSLTDLTGQMPTHYLYPGEQFRVNITVPKGLVDVGRNVSSIQFNMGKSESYMNETSHTSCTLWNAWINLQYFAYWAEAGPGASSDKGGQGYEQPRWIFSSGLQNYSGTGFVTGVPGGPGGPAQKQPPAIFVENQAACSFVETTDYYRVCFQGKLNSSMAIRGNFWCNTQVWDTKGSWISSSKGGSMSPSNFVVVIKPDPQGYFGSTGGGDWFNQQVTDMDGKNTEVATPGTAFKIVIEVHSTQPVKNVTLYLPTPVNGDWWWNTTGTNPKNSLGLQGWAELLVSEGYYLNYSDNTWHFGEHNEHAERRIMVTCNIVGNTFGINEGFQYIIRHDPTWGSPNDTAGFNREVTGSSHFYDLDISASKVSDLQGGNGKKVEFVVKILSNANASAGQYWPDTWIYTIGDMRIGCGGGPGFKILGNNVVKVELLKLRKDEPILIVKPGNCFRAVVEVMGTERFRQVIAGQTSNITLRFGSPCNGYSKDVGDWNYWNNFNLELYITRNTLLNQTYIEVFNVSRSNWWNRVTYASNFTEYRQRIDWTECIQTGSPNFTMNYDLSAGILTLTFNFTLKSGVPNGCYWWDGNIGNRTLGSMWNGDAWVPTWYFNDYQWCGDDSLRYTMIKVPDNCGIQVGEVESYWGYWGSTQAWNVDSLTGALDLDGNNMTKNDQYYVKRVFNSTNYWSQSGDRMTVNINWGGYNMWSYFALVNYTWSNQWSEMYFWYYPGNKSHVPQDRFVAQVNNTVWDNPDGAMRPAYCQIGQYTMNKTWDRIRAEFSKYDWWREKQSWNWLEINFNQDFFTPDQTQQYGPGPQGQGKYGGSSNNLFFQYAGLLLFNDTNNDGSLNIGFGDGQAEANELSHYFMFEKAKGIQLTTPQPGVDNGTVQVNVSDALSWGVSVLGLNGTTYPAKVSGQAGFAGLGWWWHDCYGMYMTEGDFSNIPSKVGISDLNFTAHFSIPNANLTTGAVNEVRLKLDEDVGGWTLFDHPQSQLSNYSLAIAFLASSMQWNYSFKSSNGTAVNTDCDSTASDAFNITTNSGVKLANIQLGGFEYTWGRDGRNYTMHSSTTPMSAFTAMYSGHSMGGNGASSVTSFSVTGTNYFVSSTFKNWDGYSVETDPYFAVYTTAAPNYGGGPIPMIMIAIIGVSVLIIVVLVVRKKRTAAKAKPSVSAIEAKQEVP